MINLENFPKIDAHFHSTSFEPIYEKIAKDFNVRYLNINTNANVFPSMDIQEDIALRYAAQYPEHFAYIASFEMEGWERVDWYPKIFDSINKSIENGAVGIKIWKNIGMEILKPDQSFLMIDDPFFEPLFSFLTEHKIPVLCHLGEPKNCWLPLEQMTSNSNKIYYANNPEFHAHLHPEIPSYEKQIAARDHVLDKYPNLTFVGAHLGSIEWSCQELAKRLDRYPNFFVDISSRMDHLQIQSVNNYDEVRDFFIRYADRILYGTDAYNNPEKLERALVDDWHFLTTDRQCISDDISVPFKGMNLPEDALCSIYFENAKKIYPRVNF